MTWPDLPPLPTLVPFEAVVRLGGVTRAADELGLTHGAVSRQVTRLERSLGTELFVRTGRSLRPTETAVRLQEQVARSLELLTAAARESRARDDTLAFVLSCEPTLMMRWLIPRLPALAPEVSLHLSAGGGPIDLARQGVHAAIRRSDFPLPPGLAAAPVFTEWIGPVCAPTTAAALEAAEPSDLSGLARLDSATRPEAWETWQRLTGQRPPASTHLRLEHFYLSLQAATAGLGVAIGPYALVRDDLETGRLVAPSGFVPDGTRYVLLTPAHPDRRTSAVYRWLWSHAAEAEPPPDLRRAG